MSRRTLYISDRKQDWVWQQRCMFIYRCIRYIAVTYTHSFHSSLKNCHSLCIEHDGQLNCQYLFMLHRLLNCFIFELHHFSCFSLFLNMSSTTNIFDCSPLPDDIREVGLTFLSVLSCMLIKCSFRFFCFAWFCFGLTRWRRMIMKCSSEAVERIQSDG